MHALRVIDPDGSSARANSSIVYSAGCTSVELVLPACTRYNSNFAWLSLLQGPNWAWHVDQYDKLSQFGFCIHGAIDG